VSGGDGSRHAPDTAGWSAIMLAAATAVLLAIEMYPSAVVTAVVATTLAAWSYTRHRRRAGRTEEE
jgi:hypothetical protein